MSAIDVVARLIFDDAWTIAGDPQPTRQQLDERWASLPDSGRQRYLDRAQRYIEAADADRGVVGDRVDPRMGISAEVYEGLVAALPDVSVTRGGRAWLADGQSSAIAAGYERQLALVLQLVESDRELQPDWRSTVQDLAKEIDRIVQRDAHPDDVLRAREAMSLLTALWLDERAAEAVYLGSAEGRC